ncbi:MAG TPA: XdhC family protein [Rhodanobacteraceae bacterium]|nr:XdhC family protein [Rhodanobacteraceae bacterium]
MNSSGEFGRLYVAAKELEADGFRQPAALATILRTRGSTYRHAGVSMLVRGDGRVICPLAGGCPQHDLVLRARRVMQDDHAQLAAYNRETGLDVLVEAGCGGELDVLIEPVSRRRDLAFLEVLARLHERRASGVLATVFACAGEVVPRPQRLVWSDAVEWHDMEDAKLVDRMRPMSMDRGGRRRTTVRNIESARGGVEVLLERIDPVHRLLVFGANPGSQALARLAELLGWQVLLFDGTDAASAGTECVLTAPHALRDHVAFDFFTSAVVMTHNLERDIAWLRALERAPLAYLGVIGSRERAARIRYALPRLAGGLHCPAGLDLGAETPEEIALSVVGEILALSRLRGTCSLAPARQAVVA